MQPYAPNSTPGKLAPITPEDPSLKAGATITYNESLDYRTTLSCQRQRSSLFKMHVSVHQSKFHQSTPSRLHADRVAIMEAMAFGETLGRNCRRIWDERNLTIEGTTDKFVMLTCRAFKKQCIRRSKEGANTACGMYDFHCTTPFELQYTSPTPIADLIEKKIEAAVQPLGLHSIDISFADYGAFSSEATLFFFSHLPLPTVYDSHTSLDCRSSHYTFIRNESVTPGFTGDSAYIRSKPTGGSGRVVLHAVWAVPEYNDSAGIMPTGNMHLECKVCMEQSPAVALVPCGHILCNKVLTILL